MEVFDIFTPGQYPEYTYVERGRGQYEKNLEWEINKPSAIVSINGPSKSGKSMLLKNVIDDSGYNLIEVRGSEISSSEDLWSKVLDKLGEPENREVVDSETESSTKEAGIRSSLFNIGGSSSEEETEEEVDVHGRKGLSQVMKKVDLDEFVLFIDDAHYIDKNYHKEISESIKNAFENGMKVCGAYIPHRSDDLMRANPDLSGRVDTITLEYWGIDDLMEIAQKGFNKLNMVVEEETIRNFAEESIGSPHLMQKLCLELCKEKRIRESFNEETSVDVCRGELKSVLRNTADGFNDQAKIFELISGDVSKRGRKGRKNYDLSEEEEADIYGVLLRAIAENPPKLSYDYSELTRRVKDICGESKPKSGNLTQAIARIDQWMDDSDFRSYKLEWLSDTKNLKIPDPYLIFYLRWSNKLDFEPELRY